MATEFVRASMDGGAAGSTVGMAAGDELQQDAVSAEQEEDAEAGVGLQPPPPPQPRLARLPLSRIKALMKADPDLTLTGQEAVFVIAKATELFIETIARDAFIHAQQGKRKTIQRKDLDNAIEAIDEFAFLEGTLD
uniref:DNA polymerase epsilon subunit 4 n=1 Tax=Geotrypetes seraphini TaxID=260995 RepID=A0A6P8RWV0_GEOSA|nr:DNA polymerase epsilon subunit 4 [Geotrypetes seraphini]